MKRLSDAEQDIMMYIWQNHHEVTSDEIVGGTSLSLEKNVCSYIFITADRKRIFKCRKDGRKIIMNLLLPMKLLPERKAERSWESYIRIRSKTLWRLYMTVRSWIEKNWKN